MSSQFEEEQVQQRVLDRIWGLLTDQQETNCEAAMQEDLLPLEEDEYIVSRWNNKLRIFAKSTSRVWEIEIKEL